MVIEPLVVCGAPTVTRVPPHTAAITPVAMRRASAARSDGGRASASRRLACENAFTGTSTDATGGGGVLVTGRSLGRAAAVTRRRR